MAKNSKNLAALSFPGLIFPGDMILWVTYYFTSAQRWPPLPPFPRPVTRCYCSDMDSFGAGHCYKAVSVPSRLWERATEWRTVGIRSCSVNGTEQKRNHRRDKECNEDAHQQRSEHRSVKQSHYSPHCCPETVWKALGIDSDKGRKESKWQRPSQGQRDRMFSVSLPQGAWPSYLTGHCHRQALC